MHGLLGIWRLFPLAPLPFFPLTPAPRVRC